MPITNKNIQEGRKILKSIINYSYDIKDINLIKYDMEKNDDFMNFVDGTIIGQELFEEWNQISNLLIEEIYDSIKKMEKITYNYFSEKEINNEIKRTLF